MINPFRKHKQHSHHHKGHMMVPRTPLSHLVIGHATFAFRILECPLNPESRSLHPAQSFKRCVLRRISQGNLYIRIPSQRLRCNQSPAFNLFGFAIPYVNFQTTDPDPEHPTGGFTQRHIFPTLCRDSRLGFVGHERPDFGRFLTPADLISTSYLV